MNRLQSPHRFAALPPYPLPYPSALPFCPTYTPYITMTWYPGRSLNRGKTGKSIESMGGDLLRFRALLLPYLLSKLLKVMGVLVGQWVGQCATPLPYPIRSRFWGRA